MSHTTIAASRSVMWVGNVRALPFAEQARAASLAGFGGISITPLGWTQLLSEGISSSDIRAICADHGITTVHLDPFCRWTSRWKPENLDLGVFPLSFFAFDEDDFLRIAEAVGATSSTAIAPFPAHAVGVEQMTEDFARYAGRAAGLGMRSSLEFIPLDWGVPDLATAWTVVREGGRDDTGIVIDAWCFERSGSTLEQLAGIPGERIDFVQLADGLAEIPSGRSRVEDNLNQRLPLGLGEFALTDLLSTLAKTGGLSSVAPELFAWQLDTMTAEEIAELTRSSLIELADRAGVGHDLGEAAPGWDDRFSRATPPVAADAAPAAQRSHI